MDEILQIPFFYWALSNSNFTYYLNRKGGGASGWVWGSVSIASYQHLPRPIYFGLAVLFRFRILIVSPGPCCFRVFTIADSRTIITKGYFFFFSLSIKKINKKMNFTRLAGGLIDRQKTGASTRAQYYHNRPWRRRRGLLVAFVTRFLLQ